MPDPITTNPAGPDADAAARGYEARDVQAGLLVVLMIGFAALFALLCGGLWWFYRHEQRQPIAGDQPSSAVSRRSLASDAPPLQPQVGHESLDAWDLQKMRQAEDATFEQLGWRRDEKTHRFSVPASIVATLQQRAATQPTTNPTEGGR